MISRHRSIMESERLASHCVAWLIVLLLAALASQLLGFPNSNGDRQAITSDEFTTPIAAGQVGGTYSTGGQLRTVTDTYASLNLVANGGFETMTATNNWTSWSQYIEGTSTITEGNVAGEYLSGTNCVKFTRLASGATQVGVYQNITAIAGKEYALTFNAKSSNATGISLIIQNSSESVLVNYSISATYTNHTVIFTATTAAPLVFFKGNLGTTYLDDVTVYPTTGLASVEDGKLKFAGGKATPGYGDPGVYWPAVTKQDGLTASGTLKGAPASQVVTFGFDGGLSGDLSAGIMNGGSTVLYFQFKNIGTYDSATDYPVSVQSGASKWFAYRSESGIWKLKYVSFSNVSDTSIYPAFVNYNATATLDNLDVRIRPLPVPLASDSFDRADGALGSTDGTGHAERNGGANMAWVSDLGTWAISGNTAISSALGSTSAVATVSAQTGNVLAMAKLTRSAGNVGIVLRYNDEDNHIFCIHDGTNGKSYKVVAGVLTQVGTTAATYAAAANMMAIADGAEVRLYYNNAYLHAYSTYTDASINDKPKVGLYTTDTGNSFNDFVVFARGNEGQYSYMGDRR